MFKKIKAGDLVLLAVIIASAFAFFTIYSQKHSGKATALIIKNGQTIHRINLDDVDSRKEIKDKDKYTYTIVAEHGRIHFEEADCPDLVCVKTGWLSKPGQTAACVPGGVLIKIIGSESDTDIMLK